MMIYACIKLLFIILYLEANIYFENIFFYIQMIAFKDKENVIHDLCSFQILSEIVNVMAWKTEGQGQKGVGGRSPVFNRPIVGWAAL